VGLVGIWEKKALSRRSRSKDPEVAVCFTSVKKDVWLGKSK
jgi:hypothetical protein